MTPSLFNRLVKTSLFGASVLCLMAMGSCPSSSPKALRLGPSYEAGTWTASGNWQKEEPVRVECAENSESPMALLSGLRGYKGLKKFDDRFVARVRVDCSGYKEEGGVLLAKGPAVSADATLDHEDYRSSGGTSIVVGAKDLPIGVVVIHDRDGDFVKNLHLVSGWLEADDRMAGYQDWWRSDSSQDQVSPATLTDYTSFLDLKINSANALDGGQHIALVCPSQHVLTGLSTQQSSQRNHKIRHLAISCSELVRN